MPEYCCCCCTLSTGTKIALTICGIEAIIGILWNTELLILLYDNKKFNPLQVIINVHMIEDFDVIHGLTLAALGLNVIWLIAAVVAARGNITLSHGQLAFWDLWTYFITLFDAGTTIYFTIKTQGFLAESQELYLKDITPTKTLTYLVLLVVSSKGILFLFLNVFFAHLAQLRGKEINHEHTVLALYVLQHISRCRATNDAEPPPAYATCSIPYSSDHRSESIGSSFSLSYDAMKGMNNDLSSGNRNIRLSIDMAREISRNPSWNSQIVNVESATNSVIH